MSSLFVWRFLGFSCFLLLPGYISAQITYVDVNSGCVAGCGGSWADAYPNLQDALANTTEGQIWVADGTYRPVACNPCSDAEREIAFNLPPDVQLFGGFTGNETSLDQRDWEANLTILSGDTGVVGDSLDNVYRIMIAENSTTNNMIDGFIFEEGNANGSFGFSSGGALYIDANPAGTGDLIVRNCLFRNNYAGGGGAIAIDCVLGGSSSAVIRDCIFEGNTASLQVVSTGAAIFMQGNSGAQVTPRITNCIFRDNFCGNDGGAVSMTPTGSGTLLATRIDSCLFENNIAADRGGAVWYRMSSEGESRVLISNSRFIANEAGGQAGAIYARSSFDNVSNDTILNCLFSQNVATGLSEINEGEGGAILLRGSQDGIRNQHIINCVFDRNYAAQRGGALATSSIVASAGESHATLINCSFSRNTTDGDGGAIHAEASEGTNTMDLINCILWQDSTAATAQEVFNNGAQISASFSNINGGVPAGVTDGGNNLNVDPEFVDPDNGDLHLAGCSVLIDVGNNAALPPLATTELDGFPRIHNGTVDLGAYEVSIIYVDDSASGANNGRSWNDAFNSLTDALAIAAGGDQVWVAAGTYRPIECDPCGPTEMETAFQLPPNMELYGGFAGNESVLEQRDWNANLSILSGDTGVQGDSLDNVYRVMIAENSTDKTILDGFIIEEGNADGSFGFSAGGGLYIDANPDGTGSIKVRNCTFRNNYAGGGGAIAIDCVLGGVSKAEIRDCRFEGNTASLRVVSTGAAIFMQGNSGALVQPLIVNCTFENNFCGNDGGAVSMTPTGAGTILATRIDSCTFIANEAVDRGGAIWYRMSSEGESRVVISNSQFLNNLAGGQGGAIYNRSSFDNVANDTIVNCLFSENTASGLSDLNDGEGGAIFLRASQTGIRNQYIVNCVFDRNYALDRGGAIGGTSVFSSAGELHTQLINSSFSGNTTDGDGWAVHLEATEGVNDLTIFNSIFWDDAPESTMEIFHNGANVSVFSSDIFGGVPATITDGGGNLSVNPQFLDPENGDLHLSGCSPVLDIGDETALPFDSSDLDADGDLAEALPIDLDGLDRVYNGALDLGAYEWNEDPPAVSLELAMEDESCNSLCDGTATATASGGVGAYAYEWSDGQTTATASALCAGTYYVTVADEFNCVLTDSVLIQEAPPLSMTVSLDTSICLGGSAMISAEASGGTEDFTYSWDNGLDNGPTQTVSPATATVFTATATDGNGCTVEEGVAVMVFDQPAPSINGEDSFCDGASTLLDAGEFTSYLWSTGETTSMVIIEESNTILVTVTDENTCEGVASLAVTELEPVEVTIGGQLSFCEGATTILDAGTFTSYLWSTAETTATIEVASADTYALTVTDENDCEGMTTVEVTEDEALQVSIAGELTYCPGATTTLDAGEFAGYTWSTGETTQTISVGTADTYSVTVSDNGDCTGETSVEVTEGDDLEVTIAGQLSFCTGTSTTLDAGDFATYLWSTGATTQTIDVSTADTYAVTVSDGTCEGESSVEVTEDDALAVTITGQLSFCTGTTTTLDAGDFNSYLWSTGATTQTIDVSTADTYAVTVSDGTCEGESSVMVTEDDALAVTITGQLSFCTGTSTTLDAGDFASYLWSTGATTQTIDVSTADTYAVTVSDGTCEGESSVMVTEDDALAVTITGQLSFCTGTSTTLDAGDFASYLWSTGATTQTIDVSTADTYAVTVSDGTCEGENSVMVTEDDALSVTISGQLSFCTGTSTTLDAGNFASYLWSTGATTQTIDVNTADTYAVTVSDGTCEGESSVMVTEDDALAVTITGQLSFCTGTSTTLDAGDFASYLWSTGATTQTIDVSTADTYAVTVSDGTCEGENSVMVTEDDALSVTISGQLNFCTGTSTTLDAGDFASYLWSTGATTQTIDVSTANTYAVTVSDGTCEGESSVAVTEDDELSVTITGELFICEGESSILDAGEFVSYLWSDGSTEQMITVDAAATYAVTVMDGNDCSGEASVQIATQAPPMPTVQPAIEGLCEGESIELLASADANLSWLDDTGTLEDLGGGLATVSPVESTTYRLVAMNACFTDTLAVPITVFPNPTVDAGLDGVVREGESLSLQGSGAVQYTWTPTNILSCSNCPNPLAQPDSTVTIYLLGRDANGCVGTDSLLITVRKEEEAGLANTFTPNGDGLNDEFIFDALINTAPEEFPDNELIVFNRWGDIIFQARPYFNDWRGQNQGGEDVAEGTYYYILRLDISEGVIYRGDVTIIR